MSNRYIYLDSNAIAPPPKPARPPRPADAPPNRPLTHSEYHLLRWMLEHGTPEAKQFLPQLDLAEVTRERCPCGCASLNFQIKGLPLPPPGINIIADFLFGTPDHPYGIFAFEKNGILSGLEVYSLAGDDAPRTLPSPEDLRPVPPTPTP